jgi:hypothetical protein
MFHGVYVKSRPKGKWHLVSVSISPETAILEMDAILNQAKIEDNDKVQACIQTFDSAFYIPELLSEVKEPKLLYN